MKEEKDFEMDGLEFVVSELRTGYDAKAVIMMSRTCLFGFFFMDIQICIINIPQTLIRPLLYAF